MLFEFLKNNGLRQYQGAQDYFNLNIHSCNTMRIKVLKVALDGLKGTMGMRVWVWFEIVWKFAILYMVKIGKY